MFSEILRTPPAVLPSLTDERIRFKGRSGRRNNGLSDGVKFEGGNCRGNGRAMRKALSIISWGVGVPASVLVLWTGWNLRSNYLSLLLVAVAVAAAIKVVAWSVRTPKNVVVVISGCVFVTARVALSTLSDGFGSFTSSLAYVSLSAVLISGLALILGVVRYLVEIGQTTRSVLTFLGFCLAAFLCLGTAASVYSTVHHNTAWYVMLPTARLAIDGKQNIGYAHRADGGGFGYDLVVTTREPWKGNTYWIVIPTGHKPSMRRCEGWTAPRSPLFAIGDVNPPCLFETEQRSTPEPAERNLISGPNFIEFTADDAKRVRVDW